MTPAPETPAPEPQRSPDRDGPNSEGVAGPADVAARVGLAPGERYRCDDCGNLTRFDILVSERSRRFWHPDLGGAGRIEQEDVRTTVESVTCRWCGGDRVLVEPVPGSGETTPDRA